MKTLSHSIVQDALRMRVGCAAWKWGEQTFRQGSALEALYAALYAISEEGGDDPEPEPTPELNGEAAAS